MFDPRLLYCSSLTTAVGGTYETNFVDSGSPYHGTNHYVGWHVLIGASALLLVLRHFCYMGRHVLIGASALLLVLRHFCYVGRHVLIGASALLLVLRHFCYVGKHVLISASTLLLVLRHLSIILYLRVHIVLCSTHFL